MNFCIQMLDGNNIDFDAADNELVIVNKGQEDVLAIQKSAGQIVVAIPLREVKLTYRSDIPIPIG